jgi:hypothetical protein
VGAGGAVGRRFHHDERYECGLGRERPGGDRRAAVSTGGWGGTGPGKICIVWVKADMRQTNDAALALNDAQKVLIADSTFQKSIASQGASQHRPVHWGPVTSASSTTLTNTATPFDGVTNQDEVILVDGPGTGQTRRVAQISDSTIAVDRRRDIVPTTDTRYVVAR